MPLEFEEGASQLERFIQTVANRDDAKWDPQSSSIEDPIAG